jgi:hypothetical protein
MYKRLSGTEAVAAEDTISGVDIGGLGAGYFDTFLSDVRLPVAGSKSASVRARLLS